MTVELDNVEPVPEHSALPIVPNTLVCLVGRALLVRLLGLLEALLLALECFLKLLDLHDHLLAGATLPSRESISSKVLV